MDMEEILNKNKYNNYSKEDGSLNIKENINYITLEKYNENSCPKCNNKVSKMDIYCNNCGEILQNIRSKREKFIAKDNEKMKLNNIILNFNLINGLKTAGLAIIILFALSLIIKFILVGDNNQVSKLINPLHIMLLSNLSNIDIFMSLFMNSAQSSINLGFLILLVLPIISFILPYRIFMKKRNTSFITHVKNSLGTAIMYTLILCIISRVSQVDVSLSNGFNQYSYGILIGFNTFDVLFKSFIIGFITVFVMGMKKEYIKENMLVNLLTTALKVISLGYVLVLVISMVLYFANVNYIYDLGISSYTTDLSLGIIFSQLAIYLWSFANLIPVSFGNGFLSILSLFNSNTSLDLVLILVSLVALSSLILIIVGSKLDNKYKSENMNPVLIFSGCYAVIMAIIGLLTTIYIGDNVASMLTSLNAIHMGFNFIVGMIISFIYSLITTSIGYKLNIFN